MTTNEPKQQGEEDAPALTPEQADVLARIIEKAARLGRTATLDPGRFVTRLRLPDGEYERLDRWQERALLAAIGSVPPADDTRVNRPGATGSAGDVR